MGLISARLLLQFQSIKYGILGIHDVPERVYGKFITNLLEDQIAKSTGKVQQSPITSGFAVHVNGNVDCSLREHVAITAAYDEETKAIQILHKTRRAGCAPDIGPAGTLSYDVINAGGESLKGINFFPSLIFTDVQKPEGEMEGTMFPTSDEFILTIPDDKNDVQVNHFHLYLCLVS